MKLVIFVFLILPVIIFSQDDENPHPPPLPLDPTTTTKTVPKSKFTVIAPYTIRQGKPYNIYVRGFHFTQFTRSIIVTITLKGKSDGGLDVNIVRTANIGYGKTKVSLSINTFGIYKGSYSLYIEGGGISQKRTLTFIPKKYTFMVFLNKAIFSPGELVRYKVLVVDSETRAVNPECSNTISIVDPNENLITSTSNNLFDDGRHEGSLQLANKASLGLWQLNVKCGEHVIKKEFQVDEYELPLIDAKLIVDSVIPFSSVRFPVKIEASYTFGDKVSGNAIVKVSTYNGNILERSVDVNGVGTFEIDIDKDLSVRQGDFGTFDVTMVFNDPLSGNKATDIKKIKIISKMYTIVKNILTPFKPGSPYKFTLTLKKYDGSPAPAGIEIQIAVNEPSTIRSQVVTTNAQGSVTVTINVPSNTEALYLRLKSEDAFDGSISERTDSQHNSRPALKVQVLTQNPKVNENVEVKIVSKDPISSAMLHIVSKGVLLKSTTIYFDDSSMDTNTATYDFIPTFRHLPGAIIIVYYIDENGNFVYGRVEVELTDGLPNYLTVKPDKSTVDPGTKVNFAVESLLDSTVSLVAVDQRSLLLKSGNNIIRSDVIKDLKEYDQSEAIFDWENIGSHEYRFARDGLFIVTNIPEPLLFYTTIDNHPKGQPSRPIENDITIRGDFIETFLWQDVNVIDSANDPSDDFKGLALINEKLPESLTTYIIQGISMNRYFGMGLPAEQSSVSVFLPFFINVDFPYSLKRNEVLEQNIILFNHLKQPQTVNVQIKKNPGFDGVDLVKYGWQDSTGFYVQTVTTKVGENIKLQFALEPKVLGFISFEVTAKGLLAGDGIKKQLRVIPQGQLVKGTKSAFIAIQINTPQTITQSLQWGIPSTANEDTIILEASVVGDIFGKALNNLDKLIDLPTGCGEQTMLQLAPAVSIYNYLKSSSKMKPELKAKLEAYILAGYQNELKFQRPDGSFSAFGKGDSYGSTWLTAFVLKYFYLARNIITIDPNVIKNAATFLIDQKQQLITGQFIENGKVFNTNLQGGSGQGPALTAYVTIVLNTILPDYSTQNYINAIDNAVKYLEGAYLTSTSTYELGIIAYALHLANSLIAQNAFDTFDILRIKFSDSILWSPAGITTSPLNVETTSYGLLLYIQREKLISDIILIVRYLINNMNNLGGYSSTQDTVMAYEALSAFAMKYAINPNLNIDLQPDVGNKITTKIDPSNFLTVQTFSIDSTARNLGITANGYGTAIVSLSYSYFTGGPKGPNTFEATYNFGDSCFNRIKFDACARYIPSGQSNMAIMVVTMPSGFRYNNWAIAANSLIIKTEESDQGTKVTFYFYSIGNTNICVNIDAYRTHTVAELKGGYVSVIDYYDTSMEGYIAYDIPTLPPC